MKGSEEWDQRYCNIRCAYGFKPNDYLKTKLSTLTPGSLLLPGEGEGRNALWAAQQGWNVTAFDYSTQAHKKAQTLFRNKGVNVTYSVTDVLDFKTSNRFDAIGLIYIHLPSETRKIFYKKIHAFLKPNGYIILENFHPEQIPRNSGGPKNPDLLYSIEELKNSFGKLKIIALNKVEVNLDEGQLHQGNAMVIRMLAQNTLQ